VVVIALHDLSLAARLADQVLLLRDGRLVGSGPPVEVLTPPAIETAYGVQAEVLRTSLGHPAIAPLRASPGR
jgi:iron complex transport system ATP-binding protein